MGGWIFRGGGRRIDRGNGGNRFVAANRAGGNKGFNVGYDVCIRAAGIDCRGAT